MTRDPVEPRWVSRLVVDAIHADLLRTHGGLPGLRDDVGLESALARPRQRWSMDPQADLNVIAAAYAFGIVRNHPFNDANKRVGFVAMAVFLGLNGVRLVAGEGDVVAVMIGLADGSLDESALAVWISGNTTESADS